MPDRSATFAHIAGTDRLFIFPHLDMYGSRRAILDVTWFAYWVSVMFLWLKPASVRWCGDAFDEKDLQTSACLLEPRCSNGRVRNAKQGLMST